ncbi:hypothetical protein [Vitreoscilla stercoraria]|uniref:DUF4124 domain-containing protein n=1 Tax=Vitreoscilla stercoraria TaxID=61 RepID=A0ABY4E7R0_VITST|nr:hypothetical protein [Vitreoscilla stercoraria]UOO91808.1 hypothetical protein LVJ81_09215 [Vitreoscilla stercoraria]
MKPIIWLACVGFGMLSVSTAQANVYHCVVNGQNVYTNKPSGNCQTAKLEKIGSYTSDKTILARQNEANHASAANPPAAAPKARTQTAAAATHAATPAPAAATAKPVNHPQNHRDQGRRDILTTELSNEKKALAQARLALSNGRLIRSDNDQRQQQNLASLQRAVDDRMQNVQALQNELSRM